MVSVMPRAQQAHTTQMKCQHAAYKSLHEQDGDQALPETCQSANLTAAAFAVSGLEVYMLSQKVLIVVPPRPSQTHTLLCLNFVISVNQLLNTVQNDKKHGHLHLSSLQVELSQAIVQQCALQASRHQVVHIAVSLTSCQLSCVSLSTLALVWVHALPEQQQRLECHETQHIPAET